MRKNYYFRSVMLLAAINALLIFANVLFAQCVPSSGMVEGSVFNDFSNDGIWDEYEQPIRNAKVTAYDDDGGLIGEAYTDANGYYAFTGLEDETKVKLVFNLPVGKVPSFEGPDNGTIVQFAEVPSPHTSEIKHVTLKRIRLQIGNSNSRSRSTMESETMDLKARPSEAVF